MIAFVARYRGTSGLAAHTQKPPGCLVKVSGTGSVLCHSFLVTCLILTALPDVACADDPVPQTLQNRPQLKIDVVIKPGGAEVTGVQRGGPATKMKRADNPNIRGALEPGDFITMVNGVKVKTLKDLRDGVAVGGSVTITVWDRNTKKSIDWIVAPK